jgi:hypothetical protein
LAIGDAQKFGDRFNLSKKSVTDTTFLTADDDFFGISFGDWVDIGNKVQRFTTQDFGEYILFLRDGVKTVSIFYLVLTRFAHTPLSALVVCRGCLRNFRPFFPMQRPRGATRFTLCTSQF